MRESTVYLDHNATTPLCNAAREAMSAALAETGNPSSVHGFGRAVRARMEAARRDVASLVDARNADVWFTSGGTEANALAVAGVGRTRILVSAIEHDSVLAQTPDEARIPVDQSGVVDLAALARMLDASDDPVLVSVMWANNETGAVQPIAEVVSLAHARGGLVHCDAIQAAGRLPVSFAETGLDLMSVSAHKLGGPAGIGALIARKGLALTPLIKGGGQEQGRRSGTENLIGIAGFGAGAKTAEQSRGLWQTVARLRDGLERKIQETAQTARVMGGEAVRLANTSCITMPGVAAETQVMALDLAGFAVSAGSACSSGKVKRSHVLDAMEPDGEAAETAIRISLGLDTTEEEIDRLVDAWLELYKRSSRTS